LRLYKHGVPELVDFQVLSRYKYKQVGDKVVYDDHLMLFNSSSGLFIHVSTTVDKKPLNLPSIKIDYRPNVPFRRPITEDLFHRYAINSNPSILKSKFQVKLYTTYADDLQKFLKGGDIVRIRHTEKNAYIFSEGSNKTSDGLPIAMLRKYRGKMDLEEKTSNDLFEIELNAGKERGRFLNQLREGNNQYVSENFRLRHLNSGRLLTVRERSKHFVSHG